ncbi:MAG: dihydroorotate dehydrogenase-like protein [Anaerolineae bacterium]|nr:MAG: dihydroorotate dehydrogenase-like protein [Anaerolineae bacterium]
MTDLKTTYLGLTLKNPLVASASPLSEKVETVKALEDAGIAAVVVYSLFEEQITRESHELDHFMFSNTDSFSEAMSFFPETGRYTLSAERYLKHIAALKEAVDIPVIGSLNGVSSGGWIEYAHKIEKAGADALELNLYYLPTETEKSSADIEDNYVQLVRDIRAQIKIPLAVKLSPFFTALPNLAQRLAEAGADGLVLFNRFYQPDFDLEALEVTPTLHLSDSHELRMPLRWVALLYGKVEVDFAITSGVHTAEDVLKAMMAGARVSMMASALLKKGPSYPKTLLENIRFWMEEHEYESIAQMQGSMSQRALGGSAALERANYMKVLSAYDFRA